MSKIFCILMILGLLVSQIGCASTQSEQDEKGLKSPCIGGLLGAY